MKSPVILNSYFSKFFYCITRFVISPTRGDTGRLVNKIFMSNSIDSFKQYLSVSKLQAAMAVLAPESGMASNFWLHFGG